MTILTKKRVVSTIVIVIVGLIYAVFITLKPVSLVDPPVAMVGGMAITTSQLNQGIPADVFGIAKNDAKTKRLFSLVEIATFHQYLVSVEAHADAANVEAELQDFFKHPVPKCSCHVYADYQEYLFLNSLTTDDVRASFWNDQAFINRCEKLWEQEHPGVEGKKAVLDGEGQTIRSEYRSCWHIIIPPSPDEDSDPPRIGGPSWTRAQAVRKRLLAGEDWAQVVASLDLSPQDVKRFSIPSVTSVVDFRMLGLTAEQLSAPPTGKVSEPLEMEGCWHLTRCDPLSDENILSFIKKNFIDNTTVELKSLAQKQVKVDYMGEGLQLVPQQTDAP